MELYVIRHAKAESRRDDLEDEHRALTAKGAASFRRVVRGLDRLGVRFDRVLHSPMLRAVQTAECLVPLVDGSTEVSPLLMRTPDPALLDRMQGSRVAVVGHEPWLSELVSWLMTSRKNGHGKMAWEKGTVAWLSGEGIPGGMTLRALMSPDLTRRLRRR